MDEGKAGGKNAKKGGKKPPAGKKGEAPEQPPRPPETPWLCRAVIDLSPLVRPGAPADGGGGGARGERRIDPSVLLSSAAGGTSKTEDGDSPLWAELRAMLTLTPKSGDVAGRVGADSDPTKGEETAAQASEVVAPAAEGVGVSDCCTGENWLLSRR